ncbi:MAG: MATE family efflux transporter [Salinispira sp.]
MKTNAAQNLLTHPIPPLVRSIAIPASIGTVFTTLYNFVDTYWAGQLSTDSLAALTPNFTIFLLALTVGVGFSSGATALISNYIGAGDERNSRYIFAQIIGYALCAQVVLSVVLLLLLRPLFLFMGTDPSVLPRAMAYGTVIVSGAVAMTLNQVFNSALAARGLSKPFRNSLILGFFLNFGLDPLLLFGVNIGGRVIIPALEERGIALATVIIQALTASYLLYHAIKAGALTGTKFKDFIPNVKPLKEIASQVIPAMFDFLVLAIGTLVINYFIGGYGKEVVAAYGTAVRIEQFALIPNFGLMIALGAIVGQNNGAGNIERVRKTFGVTLRYGLYIMLVLLPPILIFGRQLIGLISDNVEVIRIGYNYLLVQGITFYSYIVLFQANSMLRGIKKPLMIMWMSLYRQVLAPFVVFTFLATGLGLRETGVWWGIVIVNWSAAFITLWWLMRQLKNRSLIIELDAKDNAKENAREDAEAAMNDGQIQDQDRSDKE